jgi:hypothetical protein
MSSVGALPHGGRFIKEAIKRSPLVDHSQLGVRERALREA